MANEAAIRNKLENPIDFTVADGTGIEKGAVLKLTDPRTAVAADGNDDVLAGIAAREKIASDGRTQLSVYRKGIFDMVAGTAMTVGDRVVAYAGTSGANIITSATGNVSGAQIIGTALETATAGETIQVAVNVGAG